jgi:hypothetical protein
MKLCRIHIYQIYLLSKALRFGNLKRVGFGVKCAKIRTFAKELGRYWALGAGLAAAPMAPSRPS